MGWWGRYPGHGPWSHLPPYERPGWWYGRYPYIPAHPYVPWWSREDEARYLEELKKYLTESVLKEIDKRLEELKK